MCIVISFSTLKCDLVAGFQSFKHNSYTFSGAKHCPPKHDKLQSLLTLCPESESTSAMWIQKTHDENFYNPGISLGGKYANLIILT